MPKKIETIIPTEVIASKLIILCDERVITDRDPVERS
jgi:hypothetical protein